MTADLATVCALGEGYADADGDGYGLGAFAVRCNAVPAGGDCDDTDPDVFPGAIEVCDDKQNDCDVAWTSDAGRVSFFPDAGRTTDLTSSFSTSSGARTSVTLDQAGTLAVCEGTWFTSLSVTADVEIQGHGDAVLDGGGVARVVAASGSNTDLALRGLTLQNGSSSSSGGAMHAIIGTIELADVDILASTSSATGGGAYLKGNAIDLSDVHVEGCSAVTLAGGMYSSSASLTAARLDFIGNSVSGGDGGGWAIRGSTGTVEDVLAQGNTARNPGGGLSIAQGSNLALTRITSTGNTANQGSAFGCFASTCDFSDSSFLGNTGNKGAGGMFSVSSTGTFTDVLVDGNAGQWQVWVASGTLTTSGLDLGTGQTVYSAPTSGSSTFVGTDLFCDSSVLACVTL
ncbi:MAG: putative metal-binding motif-containing protein [Alphaproteobacteria bacterium]|nr:putative metal-binding motif-containing protein [Alphaproteobacteria bacterium]